MNQNTIVIVIMAAEHTSLLKKYMLNTSFHGFRYIAEPNLHWTERVFWVICCSVSWWISGAIIMSTWSSYQNNAISFLVDTNYKDWNTEFPSIYVCETNNEDKIATFSDLTFGKDHDFNLEEMIKEVAFYNEHLHFTMELCGPNKTFNEACFKRNLSDISIEVRSTCPELFRKCIWNRVEFNCCAYFGRIDTELGMCYALNSFQTKLQKYQMISNRVLGPGSLTLELNGHNNVYTLGPLEAPSAVTSTKDFIQVFPHLQAKRTFNIKDIGNQPEVRDLNIHQRKCRYAGESYLDVFPHYSYSACLMQCRKDAQLKKCGCAHHLMPNTTKSKQCDFIGLACFQNNFQELMVQKQLGSKKLGLECDCLPACTEIQLDVVNEDKSRMSEDFSILELALERLPTERYNRNVVKGLLDVAVSFGSATALFLGASYLSFVEVIFYFVIRPLTDYFRSRKGSRY